MMNPIMACKTNPTIWVYFGPKKSTQSAPIMVPSMLTVGEELWDVLLTNLACRINYGIGISICEAQKSDWRT